MGVLWELMGRAQNPALEQGILLQEGSSGVLKGKARVSPAEWGGVGWGGAGQGREVAMGR